MKKILILILLAVAVFILSCAKGDTGATGPAGPVGSSTFIVKFQNEVYPDGYYGACSDTNLSNMSSANYGVCESNWIGTNSGTTGVRRAIIKFGALKANLPAGAVIDRAYLTIRAEGVTALGATITAHALTTGFNEGTACGSIATDGPNWNTTNGTTSWGTPGGDYNSTVAGSLYMSIDSFYTFEISAATVQSWIAGDNTNYGLLLKLQSESVPDTNLTLYMSESVNIAARPKLTVYYKLP